VTTLPGSINPGTVAMLYYKRWTIEKAFNNSKSNLKETKAWSSDNNSKGIDSTKVATEFSFKTEIIKFPCSIWLFQKA
jgi:hypothetical protein